jgi:uncharacterized membrane protein YdjX (TVP38/TMEM64 family)
MFDTVVWYVCQVLDLIPWLFGIRTAIVVLPATVGYVFPGANATITFQVEAGIVIPLKEPFDPTPPAIM